MSRLSNINIPPPRPSVLFHSDSLCETMATYSISESYSHLKLWKVMAVYRSYFHTFENLNGILRTKLEELQTDLEELPQQKARNDDGIFSMIQDIATCHAMSKKLSENFNFIESKFKRIPQQPSTMETRQTESCAQRSCDRLERQTINPDFKFNINEESELAEVCLSMIEKSAEELLIAKEKEADYEYIKRSLSRDYGEIMPATYACVPFIMLAPYPSNDLVTLIRTTIRKNKDDPLLVDKIAEMCEKFIVIIEELNLQQYHLIADALFENDQITKHQIATLWYVTKVFLENSKLLTRLERTQIWERFQGILAFCLNQI